MHRLKIAECEEGMRVVLTNPDEMYDIGPSNPAVGTEYECKGTVTFGNSFVVSVIWDNHKINSYKNGELSAVESETVESIW